MIRRNIMDTGDMDFMLRGKIDLEKNFLEYCRICLKRWGLAC